MPRRAMIWIAVLLIPGWVGCGQPSGPGPAADLVATIPADVDMVTFVDLDALLQHPLWEKLQDDPFVQSGEPALQKLQELTGLDPRKDLSMALFVARGIGEPDFRLALFVRGNLNRPRLETLFRRAELVSATEGALEYYTLPDSDGSVLQGVELMEGLEDASLAFVDDFTLGFGSLEILAETVAVRNGSTSPLVETPDVGPLLREGLGSGQLWGVFRSEHLARQLRERIEGGIPMVGVLKGFSGVRVLRFTLRFSDSIDIVARTRTGTEEEARLLADTLNGFLALAKLMAKDEPDVLRFLEGTLVGLDLNSVRLSMNVDGAMLQRIQEGLFETLGR